MGNFRHPVAPDAAPQVVSLSGTSAQSAAVGANTKSVRLVSDVDCWILIGASPTADNTQVYLPAKFPQVFGISPGQKVAGICGSTGKLYITEGYGV